jgi:methylthioribose-1-phosphate isomerase
LASYHVIQWIDGSLEMLDQRVLPHQVVYLQFNTPVEVCGAIRDMVIRGAPAIGLSAAYGMALAAQHSLATDKSEFFRELIAAGKILSSARPTAANLTWAVERILRRLESSKQEPIDRLKVIALDEAKAIDYENEQMNRQMGLHALPLIPQGARIIHHCNTGPLATGAYGTALGVIISAHQHGKQVHVFVDETRPRLQGARLTSWELKQCGIPHSVVVDSASGYLMRTKGINLCLVGCDRIAANGDTANKIGTYNLALVANAHNVPFYVVGPTSTIDMSIPSGDDIPIEERPITEVTQIGDFQITPDDIQVENPAFDVTPARYITGIITDRGIAYPPYKASLSRLMGE